VCGAREAAGQRVHSLKELSWAKANVLLSTAYGQKAVHGIDSGATYAMQLLDTYLPPVGPQPEPSGELYRILWPGTFVRLQSDGKFSLVTAR
jgi:hypothetical protein